MNELTVVQDRTVTPQLWNMIREMAPIMYEARLFGVANFQQAAATMLKGHEIGIGLTASFELIQVVQGKPALSPRGALAILHTSPEMEKIEITRLVDANRNGMQFVGYECYMKRTNGFEFRSRWTMEDAKRAGLIKAGGSWEAYPENMCMWRAVGFCADVVAPDVLCGMSGMMKMPEQYGMTLSEGGDIIDMQVSSPVLNTPEASVEQPRAIWTLDQLVELFGAEAVLVSNEGKLPGTQNEIDLLAVKLAREVK